MNDDTLENIFQSAKVFANGGPYLDLLHVPPKAVKRDERLYNSGDLKAFRYQNEDFPLIPKTVFYDFIYIAAVKNHLQRMKSKKFQVMITLLILNLIPRKVSIPRRELLR